MKFKIGDKPVKNLTIIDIFFHNQKALISYSFTFPFCVPNRINEWEYVYEFPELSEEIKKEMIENPESTFSETFFLVEDELILHNKAFYTFKF